MTDYEKYGAFNIHYLPINFYYQYISYPLPPRGNTWMGGSLFLLSPVFFYAFQGIFRGRRNPDIWLWLFSILATSIPILLLMGTGWVQYGPRYTLDFTVPLLLLTASGVQWGSRSTLAWLTAISILQYHAGYLFVCPATNMKSDLPYLDKSSPWSSHSMIAARLRSLPDQSKVLDVGTASGTLARMCVNKPLHLFGVEPNADWARIASQFPGMNAKQ